MFGTLKTALGMGGMRSSGRERVLALASVLENAEPENGSLHGVRGGAVSAASRLRDMLRRTEVKLSRSDKIRLLKAVNRAKVRALLCGTLESYRAFLGLDSISGDIAKLL